MQTGIDTTLKDGLAHWFCQTCGVEFTEASETKIAVVAYVLLAMLFAHQIRRLR